jgi:hypothetical protein
VRTQRDAQAVRTAGVGMGDEYRSPEHDGIAASVLSVGDAALHFSIANGGRA